MSTPNDYQRAYQREKNARHEAENILEDKTRELYLVNQSLTEQYDALKRKSAEIELFLSIARFSQEVLTIDHALHSFITAVCKLCSWPVGHIYKINNDNNTLVPSDIWSLSDAERYQNFREVTSETILTIGIGLPGQVWAKNAPVWIDDTTQSDNFPRAKKCIDMKLKGGFGVPIICYNEIIAIAEFFCEQKQEADQILLTLVNSAATQLSTQIERRQAQQEANENYQQLLQAQIKLKQLAHYDALTSLPNRIQFDSTLKHEIARAKRYEDSLALLFIDLDFFKSVNDSFGHDVGDLLLKEVSVRLQEGIRSSDFVARLGGDEFAVILNHIKNINLAEKIAENLIERFKEPFRLNKHEVSVGISIGIACYPEAGTESTNLIKHADMAMYHAKNSGRNSYHSFSAQTNRLQAQHADIETALRLAIEHNEFSLVYQPKFTLPDRKVTGVEALLRWHHPTFGEISPGIFIPIAEENGSIIKIGEWVLLHACQQYMQWLSLYPSCDFSLAVNVSPHQLKHQHFVDSLQTVLNTTQLPPHLLELELTEMAANSDIEEMKKLLTILHNMGIKLSIDDFGTGYSTLTRLRQLPIDTIKIDKSFIEEVHNNMHDALIVKATIELARNLGLNVIAEGVETNEQFNFLTENHCPQAQGYYYSHPLTSDDLLSFLQANLTTHN